MDEDAADKVINRVTTLGYTKDFKVCVVEGRIRGEFSLYKIVVLTLIGQGSSRGGELYNLLIRGSSWKVLQV